MTEMTANIYQDVFEQMNAIGIIRKRLSPKRLKVKGKRISTISILMKNRHS